MDRANWLGDSQLPILNQKPLQNSAPTQAGKDPIKDNGGSAGAWKLFSLHKILTVWKPMIALLATIQGCGGNAFK